MVVLVAPKPPSLSAADKTATFLGNPTEIEGLIDLAQSRGAHLQSAKSNEFYLMALETPSKALLVGPWYRLDILYPLSATH